MPQAVLLHAGAGVALYTAVTGLIALAAGAVLLAARLGGARAARDRSLLRPFLHLAAQVHRHGCSGGDQHTRRFGGLFLLCLAADVPARKLGVL